MEGLRIELHRERLDLSLVERVGAAGEALPGPQVLEIETRLRVIAARVRHRGSLPWGSGKKSPCHLHDDSDAAM
jgi:hypothetical protein